MASVSHFHRHSASNRAKLRYAPPLKALDYLSLTIPNLPLRETKNRDTSLSLPLFLGEGKVRDGCERERAVRQLARGKTDLIFSFPSLTLTTVCLIPFPFLSSLSFLLHGLDHESQTDHGKERERKGKDNKRWAHGKRKSVRQWSMSV